MQLSFKANCFNFGKFKNILDCNSCIWLLLKNKFIKFGKLLKISDGNSFIWLLFKFNSLNFNKLLSLPKVFFTNVPKLI